MPGDIDGLIGAVDTDRYDRRVYSGLREEAAGLKQTEQAFSRIPGVPSILCDFWASLYKASPRLREDIPPSLGFNRLLLDTLTGLEEFPDLREASRLDEWASALGAVFLGEKILKEIPEPVSRSLAALSEAEKRARALADAAEAHEDAAKDASPGDAAALRERASRLREEASKASEEAEDLAGEALSALSSASLRKAVRRAARSAVSEAVERIEACEAFSWGCSPGSPRALSGRERFDLARRLGNDPKLLRIAELAGRMRRVAARKQRERVRHEPPEVAGVRLGNDLEEVLPSELSFLAHPALRKDFMRRFLEGELLEQSLASRVPKGRGPLVVCLDSSGSMEGEKEIWSKAVALALFYVAARQKRAFACVHFGSEEELEKFSFPDPRKAPPSEVARMASRFFGGGTDFERPLRAALEVLHEEPFRKGDVVFVTDGECRVTGEFLEDFLCEKKRLGFSVYSVVMPGGRREGVRPFSDAVAWAEPGEDGRALDLLFSI